MENKKSTTTKGFIVKLPDFIIVPYPLLEDESIGLVDERLYGIIYWFSKLKNEACTASNATLASLVKTTPQTVHNSLQKLNDKGYIQRIYKDKSKRNRKEIIPLVVFSKVAFTGLSKADDILTGASDKPTGATRDILTGAQNKNTYNKNRNNKESMLSKKFIKPILEEVEIYCRERNNSINPESFIAFYESNGWKVGRNSMKDWKAAIRTWESRDKPKVDQKLKSKYAKYD